MAGAGKKTFTAGETLTASDVNTYLMEQSVMYFGGTAARASAIPTPSTGMTSYIGVTGTATIPQIETYTGSQWQTPYGMTLLADATFSAVSSVVFDNVFSSAYRDYKIFFDGFGSTSTNIRGIYRTSGSVDASGNYDWLLIYAKDNVLATSVGALNVSGGIYFNGNQTQAGGTDCTIFAPFVTGYTSAITNYTTSNGSNMEVGNFGSIHKSSTSLAGIRFLPGSGTITGNFKIYGLRNS